MHRKSYLPERVGLFNRSLEKRIERIEASLLALADAVKQPREQPAPQPQAEVLAPVLASFAEMAKHLMSSLGASNETTSRTFQALLERAAKREMRGDMAELGRRSGVSRRAKRDQRETNNPERVYLTEVFTNCAECEARITNVQSRAPHDLAKHLTERHDNEIIPHARRAYEKLLADEQPQLFNGNAATVS